MKIELTEVTETQKHLSFEVPPDVVASEIKKVAQGYTRSARVPGFRQGKVPMTVVKQRYKDQILYDVANAMIPRLVDEALRDRDLTPVATPDIKDVVIDEGQPMTFLAEFETIPPIDPGEYTGISLSKPPAVLEVGAVDQMLERLRQRAVKWHPIEDRPAGPSDAVLMDVTRTVHKEGAQAEPMQNVTVELGAEGNPPGFDEHLTGVVANDERQFQVTYPADAEGHELAGATVDYQVVVKGLRRKELPELTDGFAKEVSDLETLEALRDRIKEDLQHEAEHEAEHKVRHDLLQNLAGRMRGAVPAALVDREIDRRLEEFVRRLMDQNVDPMKAGVDWQEFRERQKGPSEETVKSTLVLDDIARRESLTTTEEDMVAEIEKFAERTGRTGAAVRAKLENEGGLDRIESGIRREKTVAWLIEKAQVS
ncbi:MAG: trigger factor [Acidobacteria bacterium]|jgi:trigger factor|nr:trigger factor [Acidobacteriota bacterium]